MSCNKILKKTNLKIKQNKINRLTMDKSINILLAIDKAHTVPQRFLDCGPGAGGLNHNKLNQLNSHL